MKHKVLVWIIGLAVAIIVLLATTAYSQVRDNQIPINCSSHTYMFDPSQDLNSIFVDSGAVIGCDTSTYPQVVLYYEIRSMQLMRRKNELGPFITKGPVGKVSYRILTTRGVSTKFVRQATKLISRKCIRTRVAWQWQLETVYSIYATDPTGNARPGQFTKKEVSDIVEIKCK